MSWTFLIVDSNEGDAALTAQQLRAVKAEAQVLFAAGGAAALTLMEERRLVPSLIFADFAMRDMNGIEFLGQVRSRRWLERAPIAMLSGFVDDRSVVNSYRLGACTFLTRPVPTHALRETIRDFGRTAQQMNAATLVPGASGGIWAAA